MAVNDPNPNLIQHPQMKTNTTASSWTSGVARSPHHGHAGSMPNSVTYGGSYGGPYPPAGGTPNVYVTTPQQPTEGMLAYITGKVYRYSAAANQWIEVVMDTTPTDMEKAAPPKLPIELDTSGMLDALRQYRDFLDELDGLDQRYTDVVSDTLFGLTEAIEALESIEQK